jgi:hypothetical protein
MIFLTLFKQNPTKKRNEIPIYSLEPSLRAKRATQSQYITISGLTRPATLHSRLTAAPRKDNFFQHIEHRLQPDQRIARLATFRHVYRMHIGRRRSFYTDKRKGTAASYLTASR